MNNSASFRRQLFCLDQNAQSRCCWAKECLAIRAHSIWFFGRTAENITHISGSEISLYVVIKMTTVTNAAANTRTVREATRTREKKKTTNNGNREFRGRLYQRQCWWWWCPWAEGSENICQLCEWKYNFRLTATNITTETKLKKAYIYIAWGLALFLLCNYLSRARNRHIWFSGKMHNGQLKWMCTRHI